MTELATAPTSYGGESHLRSPRLSARDFDLLRRLIERLSGISLSDQKRSLLETRLKRRVDALGMDSFSHYYRALSGPEGWREIPKMIDCVTTQETRFFREQRQFDFLEIEVFPQWKLRAEQKLRPKKIRAWSAACSTGEEAYSLAMSLATHFDVADGWQLEILATDLSLGALAEARKGVWPRQATAHIPDEAVHRFMLNGTGRQRGNVSAGPEIRKMVRFEQMNLVEPFPPHLGTFDLIFCRNVMIYFTPQTTRTVVASLADRLSEGGLLLVGHAESLVDNRAQLVTVAPTVYAQRFQDGKGSRGAAS